MHDYDFPPRKPSAKAQKAFHAMTPDQRERITRATVEYLRQWAEGDTGYRITARKWLDVLADPDHPRHEHLMMYIVGTRNQIIGPQSWRFMLNMLAHHLRPIRPSVQK